MGALGPADPVALGVDHALGPGRRQVVQVVQQLLGVLGDLEVPLRQLALGDLVAAALAPAVDHLLVGQHGLVERAPVHRAVLAVGQPALAELQEQPLGPVVVLRVGGVEGAGPVEADPELLARLGGDRDVLVGERRRVGVVADRGVLGVQAERVEPHRVQHLVALLPPVAGDHVVQREHLGVAHVQVARGVGEHRQRVALLPRAAAHDVVVGAEGLQLLPHGLPLRLHRGRVVRRRLGDDLFLTHRSSLRLVGRACRSIEPARLQDMKKPLAGRGGRAIRERISAAGQEAGTTCTWHPS